MCNTGIVTACLLTLLFVGDVQHWDSYCLSVNSFCFVLLVMCNTGIVTVCLLTLFVGDVKHWDSYCLSVC